MINKTLPKDMMYGSNPAMDQKVDSPVEKDRIDIAREGYGLDKLVYDASELVRIEVAFHGYGLDILKDDPDEHVRIAAEVVQRPKFKFVVDE